MERQELAGLGVRASASHVGALQRLHAETSKHCGVQRTRPHGMTPRKLPQPRNVAGKGAFMARTPPCTVAEIECFVNLLAAACNDVKINATLERLLAMPYEKRKCLVHAWATDLIIE